MITEVAFVPLALAEALPRNPTTVVVSILDALQSKRRPSFAGARDVLNLTFIDLSEELFRLTPGDWPNEPTDTEHEELSDLSGERVPALSDALKTVRFFRKHHDNPLPVGVLVHCFAGASRSAAVAKWAAARFKVPLRDPAGQGTAHVNRRLLRLLRLADRRRNP